MGVVRSHGVGLIRLRVYGDFLTRLTLPLCGDSSRVGMYATVQRPCRVHASLHFHGWCVIGCKIALATIICCSTVFSSRSCAGLRRIYGLILSVFVLQARPAWKALKTTLPPKPSTIKHIQGHKRHDHLRRDCHAVVIVEDCRRQDKRAEPSAECQEADTCLRPRSEWLPAYATCSLAKRD